MSDLKFLVQRDVTLKQFNSNHASTLNFLISMWVLDIFFVLFKIRDLYTVKMNIN